MKIAVFGDIHANLEALTAVLQDAAAAGVTRYACTGDVVGYNANPRECIRVLRELECPVVLGNHDEDASRDSGLRHMSERARLAMKWTRQVLGEEDRRWLAGLPVVSRVEGCTVVHATLDTPLSWTYVTDRFAALASFLQQTTAVCFCGHTHVPAVYCHALQRTRRESVETAVRIEAGTQYLINAGSVGLPRDGDRRAAYAVYDTARGEVCIRRVEYDHERAAALAREGPLRDWRPSRTVQGM